jgi:hypothetical protein
VPFGSLRRRQRHLTTLHDEEPHNLELAYGPIQQDMSKSIRIRGRRSELIQLWILVRPSTD